MEYNQYQLCPEEFRFNCASFEVQCTSCGAFTNNNFDELLYNPITTDSSYNRKSQHPFYLKRKKDIKDSIRESKLIKKSSQSFKNKSKQVKNAIKTERKNLTSLGAKLTIGSGRVNGDSDGSILINGVEYYIEYKKRFNGRNILAPTKEEYNKGKDQGAKLFIINSEELGDIICMDLSTFKEMFNE